MEGEGTKRVLAAPGQEEGGLGRKRESGRKRECGLRKEKEAEYQECHTEFLG
jgi:hypothetical protein